MTEPEPEPSFIEAAYRLTYTAHAELVVYSVHPCQHEHECLTCGHVCSCVLPECRHLRGGWCIGVCASKVKAFIAIASNSPNRGRNIRK